jgi:hypothetical protein
MLFALALGLRLLVWRWHEAYGLGGDEREYLEQALTLLRTRRYEDLQLMRPPLYTFFLAVCIFVFDSLVQRLRLIQELIGVLTLVPIYLLARRLFGPGRVPLAAAGLAALNYTLAANATELLTETLFVFGLTTLFWLLLVAGGYGAEHEGVAHPNALIWAAGAGLMLGALALLRSVALPLLPLGALWLLVNAKNGGQRAQFAITRRAALCSLFFVLCSLLVILPWTLRNYATYGAPILVDTTGAENLWLDNNPDGATPSDTRGREAAKRQLYALGEDRAARQRLALDRGRAAIASHPGWFARKAWGEAQAFFALQYFDDLRERRAIWVPPGEVWLRLLLGDGLWLVILLGGTLGLWRGRAEGRGQWAVGSLALGRGRVFSGLAAWLSDPRVIFAPWAIYTLFTALLFHVELRYRLPLYPALIPYAGWMLTAVGRWGDKQTGWLGKARLAGAILTCVVWIGLMLLHRPYLGETWTLARKHARLWQAERALAGGDAGAASAAAEAALRLDPESALARVALARAALASGDTRAALVALDAGAAALPAHPLAHLLRGAIMREQGDIQAAKTEFAYERASLQDLQRWSWQIFAPFGAVPTRVSIGDGDLGFVQGFFLPEAGAFRWSMAESSVRLAAPPNTDAILELTLDAGRPAGAALPRVTILVDGQAIGQATPANGWQTYSFPLPAALLQGQREVVATIRSETFRPRDFDRASADGRTLGVMVRQAEVRAP